MGDIGNHVLVIDKNGHPVYDPQRALKWIL